MNSTRKKILWITETAVLLALLICLQWAGSQIPETLTRQLITGTCVNAVLAVTVLMTGLSSGITIALISPVFAFTLHIAPNIVTVIPIMLGNLCYVLLLWLFLGKNTKPVWKQPVALITAATAKFTLLYVLVVKIVCGTAAKSLLGKKVGQTTVLGPKMLQPDMLPLMFSWPQLITALIGGALALTLVPVLRKALKK